MKKKKLLVEFPEMLCIYFGSELPTNVVPFEVINDLINNVEDMPEPMVNHPVIFCGEGENDPICEVGFDVGGNVVFVVDGQTKFATDIENWVNNNFNELQESLFSNDSTKYFLLEGTFSGEPVTDEKLI
jgi:hypothetical protein